MSNLIKLVFLLVGSLLVLFIAREVVVVMTQHPGPPPVQPKIRVSAADLPQGLLLREDDLQWKSVPPNEIPPGAIVQDAPDAPDLKGALLRHPEVAGTVLHAADVIMPNAPGFLAATLKPGMLAVSVAVDDVSGNAGLIEPGDYVDLILTQQAPALGASNRSFVSETVLQHVRVLAAGSDMARPKSSDDNANVMATAARHARTVTLEVTPRMSEIVSVAGRLGSLSLALRSFAVTDRSKPGVPQGLPGINNVAGPASAAEAPPAPVWSHDVTSALFAPPPAPAAQKAAPVPRTVTIYRGSSHEVTADGGMGGGSGGGGVPPLPPSLATPQ